MLMCVVGEVGLLFFFFNDTATTEIYTLSLHDALPICRCLVQTVVRGAPDHGGDAGAEGNRGQRRSRRDRKSTRLNSSHSQISYAVFCLKKKKKTKQNSLSCTCDAYQGRCYISPYAHYT